MKFGLCPARTIIPSHHSIEVSSNKIEGRACQFTYKRNGMIYTASLLHSALFFSHTARIYR